MSSSSNPSIDKDQCSIETDGNNHHHHHHHPIRTVSYAGDGNEYIILDNKKYYRHELMTAFLGTMNPGYTPISTHKFGNASAVGLAAFGLSASVLGLYYAGAKNISIPNVSISLAIFYGGLVMFVSGIWEFFIGNTFAYTVFCSYASFWLAFGTMNVPAFGMLSAYENSVELGNAIGFFLIGWGVFSIMITLLVFKATVLFVVLFITLDVGLFTLAAANMTGNTTCTKVGGIFVVISAICAWYGMFAGIADRYNSYFTINPVPIPHLVGNKKQKEMR